MTREEVIRVIKQTAEEVGHAPSMDVLVSTGRLSRYDVKKHFAGYKSALEACGLERHGHGYELTIDKLFADWSDVLLRVGKVPTMSEYSVFGRYSPKAMVRNFGGWSHIPAGMAKYAQEQGLEDGTKDVLEIVARHMKAEEDGTGHFRRTSGSILRPGLIKGEPIYGSPTVDADLMLSPTNEQGVVFLFGAVARKLGFVVLRLQSEFPDCEALREMETDQWQKIKIEFEYESRNFLMHGHRADKCNLIVCWRHNWEESPLEVIELRTALRGLVNG
jgi:Homing endonuclease associated repeat